MERGPGAETPGVGEDAAGKNLVEGASARQKALDQQGAQPLSPGEQASLDQISSGLGDSKAKSPSSSLGAAKTAGVAAGAASGSLKGVAGAAKAIGQTIGNHKKGSSIAGALLLLIIFGIFSLIGLLSDKLISMMANIFQKEMSKVEYALQRRTEKIVVTLMFDKATGTLVASDNPALQKLYSQVPIDKITAALADKGFTVTAAGTGPNATVHVVTGDGDHVFTSADQFNAFFDSDAAAGSRNLIDNAAEAITHNNETYQRHFFRLLMRNEFDVKTWSAFDGTEDTKANPTAAEDEITNGMRHAALDPQIDAVGGEISCLTESSEAACPNDETQRDYPDGNASCTGDGVGCHPTWEATEGKVDGTNTQDASGCTDPATKASCEADRAAANKAHGSSDLQAIDKGLTDEISGGVDNAVADTLTKSITEKIASGGGALAIIGFIANMDDAVYGKNSKVSKVISVARESQYVGLAAHMLSVADGIKDSKAKNGKHVSGDEVNAAFKLTEAQKDKNGKVIPGKAGIEGSQVFSAIYENNPKKGIPLDPSKLVGDNNGASSFGSWYANSAFGTFVHPVLYAYKHSIGRVFSWLGDAFATILEHTPLIGGIINDFSQWLSGYAAKFLNYIVGVVINGTETGADLFNATDYGLKIAGNKFAKNNLGAPAVSLAQAKVIDDQVAYVNRQHQAALPLGQRLFDTSNPDSLTIQLVVRMPTSFGSGASQAGTYLASLFTNPFKVIGSSLSGNFIFSSAIADTTTDDGVQVYAYSNAQLSAPLAMPTSDNAGIVNADGTPNKTPDGKLDAWDCPQVKDANAANECLLDITALQSLTITSTGDNNGGLTE